jgi:hypothetical protein
MGTSAKAWAGVVDVFAGAGEVHKLRGLLQFRAGFEFGLDPVLHRLDIVVGDLFDVFDGQAVGLAEVFHQAQEVGPGARREGLELVKTRI